MRLILFLVSVVVAFAQLPSESLPAAGGGGGAPTNAKYLVVDYDGTLTDERKPDCVDGITCTDNGAGGTFEVKIDPTYGMTAGGTNTVTGTIDASGASELRFKIGTTAPGPSVRPDGRSGDLRHPSLDVLPRWCSLLRLAPRLTPYGYNPTYKVRDRPGVLRH
jgi:hypothetical protein